MDTPDLDQISDNQLWSMLQDSEGESRLEVIHELLNRAESKYEHQQASELAEQASQLAEKYLPNLRVENYRYRQGVSLWRADKYDVAIDAFKIGVSKYAGEDSRVELSKNYWGIADCSYNLGNYDEAMLFAELSVEAAIASESFNIAGLSKFIKGKSLYMLDREREAIEVCLEARSFRRKESNTVAVLEIDDYIATIYRYLGEYEEAAILLRNCLTLANATSSNCAYANFRLGLVLVDLGSFEEAREHLIVARDLYQKEDDLNWLADCDMTLSRTFVGYENVDTALRYARSATSLWDALGETNSYIRGLERQSILLFTGKMYLEAADLNQRIVNEIGETENPELLINKGWAQIRKADDYVDLGAWDLVWETLEGTDQFGQNSKHPANLWFYSLKARALYALNKHEEAMGIADSGLSLTEDHRVDLQTAFLYEIKARVSLEQNRPDKERHLAHAISLHLAFGEHEKARELSEYFKPNFTPLPKNGDVILTNERLGVPDEEPED